MVIIYILMISWRSKVGTLAPCWTTSNPYLTIDNRALWLFWSRWCKTLLFQGARNKTKRVVSLPREACIWKCSQPILGFLSIPGLHFLSSLLIVPLSPCHQVMGEGWLAPSPCTKGILEEGRAKHAQIHVKLPDIGFSFLSLAPSQTN